MSRTKENPKFKVDTSNVNNLDNDCQSNVAKSFVNSIIEIFKKGAYLLLDCKHFLASKNQYTFFSNIEDDRDEDYEPVQYKRMKWFQSNQQVKNNKQK